MSFRAKGTVHSDAPDAVRCSERFAAQGRVVAPISDRLCRVRARVGETPTLQVVLALPAATVRRSFMGRVAVCRRRDDG